VAGQTSHKLAANQNHFPHLTGTKLLVLCPQDHASGEMEEDIHSAEISGLDASLWVFGP
jgi:hypothetical protein